VTGRESQRFAHSIANITETEAAGGEGRRLSVSCLSQKFTLDAVTQNVGQCVVATAGAAASLGAPWTAKRLCPRC
jgi:hypothetical protein